MPEICVGITGDQSKAEYPLGDLRWSAFGWIIQFLPGQEIVCLESRTELRLVLEGYRKPVGKCPKAIPFGMRLYRKLPDRQVLMWCDTAANTHVNGPPQLKWAKQ